MAYCLQTLAGITLDCSQNMGGIKRCFIANWADIDKITADTDKVTAITMKDGAKFKAYQFRRGTSSMTSELTADETNGLNFVTTTLSLVFTKQETAKRVEMSALAISQLAVIVEDNNGIYWLLTKDDYASASAGTAESGTAKTDRNAYTLTLSTENNTYPFEVDGAIIEELVEA